MQENCQEISSLRPHRFHDPIVPENYNHVSSASSPDAKVRFFRELFKGREDIYARRYVSTRAGKIGYSPACSTEWTRGLCDKKHVSCAVCPNRRFVPLDDDAVRMHLMGHDARMHDFTIGCYPLLTDDTVRFAVIDLDGKNWRSGSSSICDVLKQLGLPVARERSRSGDGVHFWFFFNSPQPARFVRDALTYILSLAMEHNPEIGLSAYDRIFPNQDRVPKGGFGNLIALPLQGTARRAGNTCFVNDHLVPFSDQWSFLSGIPRITGDKIAAIRARFMSERRFLISHGIDNALGNEPWMLFNPNQGCQKPSSQHVSCKVQITLANAIYFQQVELTPDLKGKLIRLAAFVNPEYENMQRLRLNVYNTPRIVDRSVSDNDNLVLPRGCLDNVLETLRVEGVERDIIDKRQKGSPLEDVSFVGRLRDEQQLAARDIVTNDTGVLAAGTAFGKTVLAAWIVAARKVSTLILVNRRELQMQWIERLSQFLGIPEKGIGRIGGGAHKATERLDVALIQTLSRMEDATLSAMVKSYGQVIVDECHVVSAPSFERVVHAVPAQYVLGLSATPIRKDGQHPIIEMECGPVRHRVDATGMDLFGAFRHLVRVRPTPFVPKQDTFENKRALKFADIISELVGDTARNEMIVRDVIDCVREGRTPVVISERRDHLDVFEQMLRGVADHVIVLRGGLGNKKRTAIRDELDAISPHETRILLATGAYLGEGFDDARLDTLFLTLPISWRGRLVQYAGRLHRRCDGKREVRIYDYLDQNVVLCSKMFNRRAVGYRDIGYDMVMADDPQDGWPKSVEIPISLRTDETFSDSIRRIGREGCDDVTADLFVNAALKSAHADDGARSASERFLFRFLDGLPKTKGMFTLNGRLDIPFGPNPYMEVDLLCKTKRLAVEIDGGFHFADADHYRRDRRKDFLLQRNGFLVVRFLADDVTRRLQWVMDEITTALEACR